MSNEEKKDLRLAIIVLLSAVFLGFFIGRASACDSYEDCIHQPEGTSWDASALKAIAYKLDEISNVLQHGANPMGGPYLFRKSDGWKQTDDLTGFIQVYKTEKDSK